MSHARVYIIAALVLDVLYAAVAIASFCIAPRVQSLSFAGLRSNIEHAATVEDLRPRARNAATMLESSDRALMDLYRIVVHSLTLAIAVAALNILLLSLGLRTAQAQA